MAGIEQMAADQLILASQCLEQALAYLDQAGAVLCAAQTSQALESVREEIAARAPDASALQER